MCCLILVFFTFWLISYFKCEIQTIKYGNEFEKLYEETGMIDSVDYLKVLKYSEEEAKVYYVSKNIKGDIIYFIKSTEGWKLKNWISVWSKYGSADNILWPYIR